MSIANVELEEIPAFEDSRGLSIRESAPEMNWRGWCFVESFEAQRSNKGAIEGGIGDICLRGKLSWGNSGPGESSVRLMLEVIDSMTTDVLARKSSSTLCGSRCMFMVDEEGDEGAGRCVHMYMYLIGGSGVGNEPGGGQEGAVCKLLARDSSCCLLGWAMGHEPCTYRSLGYMSTVYVPQRGGCNHVFMYFSTDVFWYRLYYFHLRRGLKGLVRFG